MQCATCVYFHQTDGPDEGVGQCRRIPPVILQNTMVIENESVKAIVAEGVFPAIRHDAWCGEHRDKVYNT